MGRTSGLAERPPSGWHSAKLWSMHALTRALPYALLRARALRSNPVTVLCYHTLRPDDERLDAWTALRLGDFERQIEVLLDGYEIVSLDDALRPLGDGWHGRPRAVVTFDDGEWGLHAYLLPFVERRKIPVTVYVATSQIEIGEPYWFDAIMNALQTPGAFVIDLRTAGLRRWTIGPQSGAERWAVISQILEALKTVAPGRREGLARQVIEQAPPLRNPVFTPLQPMTPQQLKELSASAHVTIASHSHCHNLLNQIGAADIRDTAKRSRALLEAWTGKPIRHFAYPNGNHNAMVRAVIGESGYATAAAVEMRLWTSDADRLAFPRLAIGRYETLDRFKLRLVDL